ncbi:PfkB family carbohydrate kinase [Streptacidiphilus sp. N1-12]|uniref:PfkB family carbohydrate kinase n=2 Tax=Streptacidiphilus alkalitolerans TaxID=3342712 RepID=A0ABV6W836_9ACTN
MIDLLVIGDAHPEVLLRGTPPAAASGALTLGGTAAVVARGAARLGLSVALVAVVGHDPAGDFVLDTLSTAGVDIRRCLRHETLPTALTVRLDRADADRSVLSAPGCLPAFDPRQARLPDAGHLHAASPFLQPRLADALPAVFDAFPGTTSLDLGHDPAGRWDLPPGLLTAGDLLFADETGAMALTGTDTLDLAMRQLGRHGCVPVVTRGPDGAATLHAQGYTTAVGPARTPVVDTIGAGGSFTAGFLARWLDSHDIPGSLAFGCACGARSTGRAGGTAGQPSAHQALAALDGIRVSTEPPTPPTPRQAVRERSSTALLPVQRKRAILAVLATEHAVGTTRLAARFGVSTSTVRRDLEQLHEEGRLERVHGGGHPPPPSGRTVQTAKP